ncbi:MAG: DUF4838 domain-containing protein [Victivallales bacterium]|nr:DUF4838 domain-containing protein [Victivallales bacterium]
MGYNSLVRQAGFKLDKIKADGYTIAVKNGNIYIFGHDTKDGTTSTKCGFSKGTLFGVYTFIEKYLGVRWFMPGEEGEYYMPKSTITVKDSVLTENPDFRWRYIPYLVKDKTLHSEIIDKWLLRQKINSQAYRMSLIHYHVWQRIFTNTVYDAHPEYFSMLNGKRMMPVGDRYKICTSNHGAINFHAQEAIKFFDNNPLKKGYSLSPTDSAGYCQCPDCMAQDEPEADANGKYTRRILLYYNAVAKIVYDKYPDKYMCGYIYADYLYPPQDKSITLSPNLFLVVASSLTYGYTYFRPEVQKKWDHIMRTWSSMTQNIAYYDLPMHSSPNNGAPLAPGVEQLKKMIPELKNFKVKSLYIYGDPEWGHAALYNYLLAKMMWNADLDVDTFLGEYYTKCYGAGAPDIKKMYELIDASMKSYYMRNTASYTLTSDILKKVYVANLNEIESLYFAALGKSVEGSQKQRLEMLGDNLKVMYYMLKAYGLVKNDNVSRLDMSNKAFKVFSKEKQEKFYLPPLGAEDDSVVKKLRNVAVRPHSKSNNTEKLECYYLRDGVEVIIQAQNDNVIKVDFNRVTIRGNMISYLVVNSVGKKIISGVIAKNEEISFNGSNGEIYHMFIKTQSSSYALSFSDVPYAFFAGKEDAHSRGLHFLGKTTPLYFYVGDKVKDFSIVMSSASNPGSETGGETAEGELYDPNGKLVGTLSTVAVTVDTKTVKNPIPGFWKYKINKAPKGVLDDVFVSISGKGMSGFASPDPEKLLSVDTD